MLLQVIAVDREDDVEQLAAKLRDNSRCPALIRTLRAFFDADQRWLDHYGFRPLDLPTLFGGLSS